VGGGQQQAAADAVGRVDPAHDPGVVDDRDQVRVPRRLVPARGLGVGAGVVPVLGVQPGDDLGYAGGAAGELEHGHVVRVDAGLDVVDHLAGDVRVGPLDKVLDPRLRSRLGGADGQHVPHGGVAV